MNLVPCEHPALRFLFANEMFGNQLRKELIIQKFLLGIWSWHLGYPYKYGSSTQVKLAENKINNIFSSDYIIENNK